MTPATARAGSPCGAARRCVATGRPRGDRLNRGALGRLRAAGCARKVKPRTLYLDFMRRWRGWRDRAVVGYTSEKGRHSLREMCVPLQLLKFRCGVHPWVGQILLKCTTKVYSLYTLAIVHAVCVDNQFTYETEGCCRGCIVYSDV